MAVSLVASADVRRSGSMPGGSEPPKAAGYSGFAFTTCLSCRSQAWRAPDGEIFCGTCEARAERLSAALASVANPPVYRSLRSALLGGTPMAQPRVAAG